MKCPKCKSPLEGYKQWCPSCGDSSGYLRRALTWTLIPTAIIGSIFGAQIIYQKIERTGSSRNEYSNAIEVQNSEGRSAAFASLMRDGGQTCSRTTKSLFRGDIGTNATWNVRCEDSGDWLILIALNGATRIFSCGPLDKAGTPCWKQL